jgi:nucleotide-binding universal stress UspA family protein
MTGAQGPTATGKLKILVPINFSRKSEMALDYALMYSRNYSADIYLFHVFEAAMTDYRQLDRLTEEYLERMKQQVINAIDRLSAQGIVNTVDDVYRRIGSGKPAVEILKMASGIGADMIVMGASGGGAMKKLITQSPCTLIMVKEKDTGFVVT